MRERGADAACARAAAAVGSRAMTLPRHIEAGGLTRRSRLRFGRRRRAEPPWVAIGVLAVLVLAALALGALV